MSVQVKRRRDTAANLASFTGAPAELLVDTTNNRVQVHDGSTPGGWPAAKLSEVVTNTRAAVSDAAYSALASDRLIAYTALTASRVVSLPAASAYPTGTSLRIVDESGACSSSKTITVGRAGSDTIDGAASFVIDAAYAGLEIESNGSNAWTILSPEPNVIASLIGVGTAPDPSNPLSVYGASALFNGTNFNVTLNKAASTDTASLIFQDGFSGRAQMGLAGSDNFSFMVSPNGSAWTTAIGLDAATGAATFANQRTGVADAAYSALVTDRLVAYTALTAPRAVTLPSAASFPPGHPLGIIDESGACSASKTITISRAGSDTINGLTSVAIASAFGALVLESNGSNAWTVIKRAGGINVIAFPSSGTYPPTPGMTMCDVYLLGGGGGGGGGALETASTACSGGGGGGGGAFAQARFSAAEIGSSQTVTIGAGGAAGAAATSNTTGGGDGGQGGVTSIGSLLQANAGGGGSGGNLSATASGGGGGGGAAGAGGNSTSGTGGTAGSVGGVAGGSGAIGTTITQSWGGAGGGGGTAAGASTLGGNSLNRAPGGGSGGGLTSASGTTTGGQGGGVYSSGQAIAGGAHGAANANGSAGSNPSLALFSMIAGTGGGGGGSAATTTTAGNGGQGGYGAGGGGGGSAVNGVGSAAGAGGQGGPGYCVIVEFF